MWSLVDRVTHLRRNPRAGQVVQSLGAGVLLQLCLFASGIAIARGLGPSGRGDVAIVLALPPAVMQVVCVGFPSALTYYISRNRAAWSVLVRRVAVAAVAQTVLGLAALFALNAAFLAGKPAATYTAGFVAMVSLPPSVLLYYTVHIVQGLGDIRRFNLLRVSSVALYSAGIFGSSLIGLTVIRCAVVFSVSQTLLAVVVLIRAARCRSRRDAVPEDPNLPDSRTIARFAMAGFLAQISPVESFRLDTLAVAAFFPSQIVGYYAVANSVTNPPLFAADALVSVGYPHVAAQDEEVAVASAKRYMRAGVLLCGGSALLLAAVLPFLIPLLFGRAYLPAVGTGELLACAAAILGLRRMGNDFLRALGKPALSTRLELITLVAFGVGLATLGPWGSGHGVALALIAAAGLGLILFSRILRNLTPSDVNR